MKNIAYWLLLLIPFQIYAQASKDEGFSQKVFSSTFSEEDKSLWPLQNNQFAFYFIRDHKYLIQGRTAAKTDVLLPSGAPKVVNFKAEASVMLKKNKDADGAIGLAIGMSDKQDAGLIFEINQEQEFRILALKGEGNLELVNQGKRGGWKKAPRINKADITNTLTVIAGENQMQFFANSTLLYTIDRDEHRAGTCGFYVDGRVQAEAYELSVYASGSNENSGPESMTKKQNPDSPLVSTDIHTLTTALLDCRKQSQALSTANENYRIQLSQSKNHEQELQKFISQNLDVKLQQEVENQRKKSEALQQQLKEQEQEIVDLRIFKKNIEEGKDGDLVITLSENLKKEQARNEELQKNIRKLQAENQSLKTKGKKL